jgi:hypothetical protein
MSEADRVFPHQEKQAAQTSSDERRLIITPPRKGGFGGGKSRVVEVVHVQRGRSKPTNARSRPAPSNVRAETWPEGFRAKSPPPLPQRDIQPVAPEPAQPTVHVMAMWEPSAQESERLVTTPDEPLVGTVAVEHRKPRTSKPNAPTATVRHFADPFAGDDDGANCIRCGYLVEQARERRGLMTCSQCS